MATRANETKRNLYATEGVVGGAALAAIGSNRIPEAVNGAVRAKRKSEYRKVKAEVTSGKGQTEKGKWVKLKRLSDEPGAKVFHPAPPNPDGSPRTDKAGKPVGNMSADKSERVKAANRGEQARIKAKNIKNNKATLPFPTSNWKLEDDPKQKVKAGEKPRQIKIRHELDQSTGRRIKTAAAIGEGRRKALLAIGIPAATAVMWHGGYQAARQQRIMNQRDKRSTDINKKMSERDVSAAVTGGTVGVAAYQAPSMTEWIFRGKEDKKLKKNPKTQATVDKWKKKHKIEAGTQKGLPIWDKAYRDYPKSLPGSRLRRTMAYTHTGGTGRAAFLASAAGGAGLGVLADRKILRKKKTNA